MAPQDLVQFEEDARRAGYDEIVERRWPPNTVVDTHRHPFDAHAIVVDGEMWLTCDEQTRRLQPGDTFDLETGQLHAERYGPDGATYLVARRNAPVA